VPDQSVAVPGAGFCKRLATSEGALDDSRMIDLREVDDLDVGCRELLAHSRVDLCCYRLQIDPG
jgi:hypothetical protein